MFIRLTISHTTRLKKLPREKVALLYEDLARTPIIQLHASICSNTNASTAYTSDGFEAKINATIRIATLKMLTESRSTWTSDRRKWFANQTARIYA
jgi:hypothetical protein